MIQERKKHIVVLSGSGLSAESGIGTFRDAGGLWEQYKIEDVCTHDAWCRQPNVVNEFYNMLRVKYKDTHPNEAHKLIAELEKDYEVSVITQNVDNLHELAGSTAIVHLHGEIMKACSAFDVDDPKYHVSLPHDGFGDSGLEITQKNICEDGSQYRPFIVFFGENVPNLKTAEGICASADILLVIGTSLQVYPAAGLIFDVPTECKIYVIDPNDVDSMADFTHIKKTATEGMKDFIEMIKE